MNEGICLVCHKTFTKVRGRERICPECRERISKRYEQARKIFVQDKKKPKECIICGNVRTDKGRRYTCSGKCSFLLEIIQNGINKSNKPKTPPKTKGRKKAVKMPMPPKIPHNNGLDICCAAAKELGLTYGEYMAQKQRGGEMR